MHLNRIKIATIIGALSTLGLAVGLSVSSGAASTTANTTINGIVASTVSLATSTGTINMNVTPTAAGAITTATHNVTVTTNSTAGYNLTLASTTATTNLASGANTIAASAGTLAAPVTLAANTWGYRVDSLGGFGTGGSVVSSVPSSTMTFAGVPATGSPHTIKTTSAPATTGEATPVYYGINATTAKPSGTYTNTVVYTATTK